MGSQKCISFLGTILLLLLGHSYSAIEDGEHRFSVQDPEILQSAQDEQDDELFMIDFNSNIQFNVRADETINNFGNSTLQLIGDSVKDTFQNGLNSTSNPEGVLFVPKKLLQLTFIEAENDWMDRLHTIYQLDAQTKGADAKSPVGIAYAFSAPNDDSMATAETSALLELASKALLKQLESEKSRTKREVRFPGTASRFSIHDKNRILRAVGLNLPSSQFTPNMGFKCSINEETTPCDPNARYRTYTGWCNNVRNPNNGKSVSPLVRMIPAAYDDGISAPRTKSVTGAPLPSPRMVSSKVHIDSSHLSNVHTLLVMQFGQFVDHDITLTPVHRGPDGKILNCRDCNSYNSIHPECWPISVPRGDAYYPVNDERSTTPYCLPFTRSLPGQQTLGPREQLNQNSAYIDASHIYGENACKARDLRVPGGKLNVTIHPRGSKPFPPQITFLKECRSPSGHCFYAGDPRASEHPGLAAMHTVFLRLHNYWAEEMQRINPHWSDEQLYQETRRLVVAVNQHLIYNELLPVILGPTMINAYELGLQNDGYYSNYDPSCSASAFNEFSTAAFRFGHSMVRPYLSRMDSTYRGMKHVQLRDGFFNSDMMYDGNMVDELIRGMLSEPIEEVDPFITNEVSNHLFEDKKKPFSGLDLVSLNLNRGRDHGLPGYNNYRQICGLKRADSFQDLLGEMSSDVVTRLEQTYAHVDDIDLFTGALVERAVSGGLLGPVMTCIIGTQFKHLRKCDRYWYETSDPVIRFTPQQLGEIRKMTLSKVLCDNLDTHSDIQKQALKAPHKFLNPRIPCNRLPSLNIEVWRESGVHSPAIQTPNENSCIIAGKPVPVGKSELNSPCVSCICTPQGTKCASLRITSCSKLLTEAKREDILKDEICMSQCGFLVTNGVIRTANTLFPSSRFQGRLG